MGGIQGSAPQIFVPHQILLCAETFVLNIQEKQKLCLLKIYFAPPKLKTRLRAWPANSIRDRKNLSTRAIITYKLPNTISKKLTNYTGVLLQARQKKKPNYVEALQELCTLRLPWKTTDPWCHLLTNNDKNNTCPLDWTKTWRAQTTIFMYWLV